MEHTKDKRMPKRPMTKRRRDVAKSEFDKRIISIRRVSRVVAGGRRFSFSATIVIGNKKGKVGIGVGAGLDTATAIEKAGNNAQKHLVVIPLTENSSIAHDVDAKYCASQVALRPAQGLVAGGAVRTVAELAGIKNINTKILSRSKSAINNARATIKALSNLVS